MSRMVRNLVGVKEEEGVDMKRYVRRCTSVPSPADEAGFHVYGSIACPNGARSSPPISAGISHPPYIVGIRPCPPLVSHAHGGRPRRQI